MNYKVKNLTSTPEGWTAELEYWEGCYCSHKSVDVVIYQESRPNDNEVINTYRIQSGNS